MVRIELALAAVRLAKIAFYRCRRALSLISINERAILRAAVMQPDERLREWAPGETPCAHFVLNPAGI